MKIEEISIRDFKRFTNLRIEGIPESARLVVMAGPNGAGKSSTFEALNYYISPIRGVNYNQEYHLKASEQSKEIQNWDQMHSRIDVTFHNVTFNPRQADERAKKAFYIRSAYRHEAEFSISTVGNVQTALEDARRPPTLISAEARVSDNYNRMIAASVAAIYGGEQDDKTIAQLREHMIGRVRTSMQRVFGDLILSSTGSPMSGGTFLFEKGTSKDFRYANLSSGEKAAFDLLLDFILKTESFNDTVFCIDEPELHLHTRLQGRLLKEMLEQLPPKCQLWIATHSIGMMRAAKDLYQSKPNEVAFLDFEGNDYDRAVIMRPVRVDRSFWRRVFHVALDDLSDLIAPAEIVFCEGKRELPNARKNTTFDAQVYRTVFQASHPDTEFVPLGGTKEIERNAAMIGDIFTMLFSKMRIWRLIDRDDRSDAVVAELRAEGTRVLSRRDIESYLWDDEVIAKLCSVTSREAAYSSLAQEKIDQLAASVARGNPADDIKSIAGPMFNVTRQQLGLTQAGNDAEEFGRVTLAPLITPDMRVYIELEADIFG